MVLHNERDFSHASSMAVGMDHHESIPMALVIHSVFPVAKQADSKAFTSLVKYLSIYWMDGHSNLYRHV